MSTEEQQIKTMIDFIEGEAREKEREIQQAAAEEYDAEKMRLKEAEKTKIRSNFEKKKKQCEIDRRVARAHHGKEQRIRIMDERVRLLDQLREMSKAKILTFVNSKQYTELMAGLISQSIAAVATDVKVKCRQKDEGMVKQLLPAAKESYMASTGKDIHISVSSEYLVDAEDWGGVIVQSADGRITCDNTLAVRMKHCFVEQLPRIRYNLMESNISSNTVDFDL
eukprot:Tbor_TRINITY_DN7726_c0_g1::TRINITY_DN7726_c0_g1_i1::g.12401::m.12401/K02150/ATPeV1E, ATP6E; V-type H+-transporting ATPase subunit E